MVNLVESMSLEKPTNGWFVPNCDREGSSVYLAAGKEAKERRIAVTVPLFSNPDTRKNALQVVHRWLNEVPITILEDPRIFSASCQNQDSRLLLCSF